MIQKVKAQFRGSLNKEEEEKIETWVIKRIEKWYMREVKKQNKIFYQEKAFQCIKLEENALDKESARIQT